MLMNLLIMVFIKTNKKIYPLMDFLMENIYLQKQQIITKIIIIVIVTLKMMTEQISILKREKTLKKLSNINNIKKVNKINYHGQTLRIFVQLILINYLILILLRIQKFALNVVTIKLAGGLYKPTLLMNQAHNFSVVQNATIHGEPPDRLNVYINNFICYFFIYNVICLI